MSNFLSRCGCSADLSQGVNDRTMFHADNAYFYPAVRIHSRRLRTNTVSNTAFRGFGGPQGMVFAERMMEAIAIRTGHDALDVRKRNFYRQGPRRDALRHEGRGQHPARARRASWSTRRTIGPAAQPDRRASTPQAGSCKKGLSLTPVKFGISFTLTHLNQAGALVHVYTDGSVHLNHGGTEMGQGLYIKVAQVVAEEFGIDARAVRITATTHGKVPNTSADRRLLRYRSQRHGGTQGGLRASSQRLIAFAAQDLESAEVAHPLRERPGHHRQPQRSPSRELAKQAHLARISLSSTGFYATPKVAWDRAKAKGRPFFYFAYGAACAEVDHRYADRRDAGRSRRHSPRCRALAQSGASTSARSRAASCRAWAGSPPKSWSSTHKGRLRTHAPSTYKIPCASDVPADFRVALYESRRATRRTRSTARRPWASRR